MGYQVGSMVSLAEFQADLPDMDWDAEILCPGEMGEVEENFCKMI